MDAPQLLCSLSLILLIHTVPSQPDEVYPCFLTIHPEKIAVVFGGSVNLNCTFSCINYTNMEWEVPVEHVTKKGDGWISLSIPHVTEQALQPLCVVRYGESNELLVKAIINVYN